MSHDLYASLATAEITSIFRRSPDNCFENAPNRDNFSAVATKEGKRSWPISDGVIHVVRDQTMSYEIAVEFKRPNEGLHGILTAIGQSHAYLHKGFSGSIVVIPNKYDSHSSPGEYVHNVLNATSQSLPIGVYVYDEPDTTKASPFADRIQCIRPLRLDVQDAVYGQATTSRIETQWGHVREGSTDLHAFFVYLQTAKRLAYDNPAIPTPNLPIGLSNACNILAPDVDIVKYLCNATSDEFHDHVWRVFWTKYILHDDLLPIWRNDQHGNKVVNDEPSKIFQPNGNPKKFFSGRRDSIKNRVTNDVNQGSITEDDAWRQYAQNIHNRAHSYREDIDSGLAACGLLESDGRPTELGYRFVDACERTDFWDKGISKAIFVAALLKNANYAAFLHYIYRLSENRFKEDPLAFSTNLNGHPTFDSNGYREWLAQQLADELGVMRTVTQRGGQARQPLQAELAVLRNLGLVGGFRVGVGLEINWPDVQRGLELPTEIRQDFSA